MCSHEVYGVAVDDDDVKIIEIKSASNNQISTIGRESFVPYSG